jgi:hypothetical protein
MPRAVRLEERPMSADLKHQASSGDHDAVRTREPVEAGTATEASARKDGNAGTSEPTAIDDVLDVEGASRLLRVGRNTIYELVGRNEIPHRR